MTNSVVRPTRITTMPSTTAPAPLTMTSACTAHLVAALHLYRRRPVVRQPGTGARVVAREGLCGRESLRSSECRGAERRLRERHQLELVPVHVERCRGGSRGEEAHGASGDHCRPEHASGQLQRRSAVRQHLRPPPHPFGIPGRAVSAYGYLLVVWA